MKSSGNLNDHPRVLALVERFSRIDAGMRDLPLYNEKVSIEAIGFHQFGDGALLGVLLTPWFMNVVLLPIEPAPMEMAKIGGALSVELPAGKRTFVIGGDETIGLFQAHSLHSPVLEFTLPGQAGAQAQRTLALPMTPPAAMAQTATRSREDAVSVDRCTLLFGRRHA